MGTVISTTNGWKIGFGAPEIVTFVTVVTLIFRSFLENGWKVWWIVSHLSQLSH